MTSLPFTLTDEIVAEFRRRSQLPTTFSEIDDFTA